jgi:hypothetical protein
VEIVKQMKEQMGIPYGVICGKLGLSLSSFNRWRFRIHEGELIVKRPGPKKVEPFDPAALNAEIESLGHGRKRSAGATELYRRYRFGVSRRELGQMVAQVRQDLLADQRRNLRRLEWQKPGIAWAMDGTEYDMGPTGKIYLYNMQDLGSRYKFLPMAGAHPIGEEIAGYLSNQIDCYGAPLILKRDNEGNLNHAVVNAVLEEFLVLPLNSPEDYPPYNGAIEESQREVKRCLRDKFSLGLPEYRDHVSAYVEAAIHDLNHRLRPCLEGKTSCQVFFAHDNKSAFRKRERREIYDIIMERTERILSAMKQSGKSVREAAWRIAVESWLKSRGFIKVHTNPKVSPNFIPFLAHK